MVEWVWYFRVQVHTIDTLWLWAIDPSCGIFPQGSTYDEQLESH